MNDPWLPAVIYIDKRVVLAAGREAAVDEALARERARLISEIRLTDAPGSEP